MFQSIKINTVKGADYNPRFLSDESFSLLKESISKLGCIKPIIVNSENRTIVAGHQRTKSSLAVGIPEIDAFFLDSINQQDEVRFNQLHNMCEVSIKAAQPTLKIKLPEDISEKYIRIENKDIEIVASGLCGEVVNIISKLIIKYGNFSNAICDRNGNIIISSIYAYAQKLLGGDLYVTVIPDDLIEYVTNIFSKDFGVFNYDNTPKNTFAQSFAQKFRLRGGKVDNKSHLYEGFLLPNTSKNKTILDFGSGQGDYCKRLKKEGYKILEIEFFRRKKGENILDFAAVNEMFLKIKNKISSEGLFDVVICDSVFNSVDSLEAEKSVLQTIHSLTKIGGRIYFSGRKIEEGAAERKKSFGSVEKLYFIDENGFTGNFRNGRWFYQKFHSYYGIKKLCKDLLNEEVEINYKYSKSSGWYAYIDKTHHIPADQSMEALRFEFGLPLPNGKHYTFFEKNIEFFKKLYNGYYN